MQICFSDKRQLRNLLVLSGINCVTHFNYVVFTPIHSWNHHHHRSPSILIYIFPLIVSLVHIPNSDDDQLDGGGTPGVGLAIVVIIELYCRYIESKLTFVIRIPQQNWDRPVHINSIPVHCSLYNLFPNNLCSVFRSDVISSIDEWLLKYIRWKLSRKVWTKEDPSRSARCRQRTIAIRKHVGSCGKRSNGNYCGWSAYGI